MEGEEEKREANIRLDMQNFTPFPTLPIVHSDAFFW